MAALSALLSAGVLAVQASGGTLLVAFILGILAATAALLASWLLLRRSGRKSASSSDEEIAAAYLDLEKANNALLSANDFLENLIANANAPIIIWDAEQRITHLNRACERLIGIPAREVIGQRLDFIIPRELSRKFLDFIERTSRESGSLETVEIPLRHANGEIRTVLWSAAVYHSGQDELKGTIAQGLDITARKQAEEEVLQLNADLRRRTEQLQLLNNELEAFAHSVSHDLRAPLRGIDGWSMALLEDYHDVLDERGKQYLARVRAETQRMGHLIDDMLKLSRVSRATMQLEPVNISELAQQIAERLKQGEPERNVEFVIAPQMQVNGDAKLLEIALQNLIENAWKFTSKREKARIELGVANSGAERGEAFFVRDNGVGFDMNYVHKLFQPFQRLHHASDYPGTGIGLVTAQRILRRHGGTIWTEAEVGRGATFYFQL